MPVQSSSPANSSRDVIRSEHITDRQSLPARRVSIERQSRRKSIPVEACLSGDPRLVFQSIVGWKRGKASHWSIITLLVIFFVAFGVDGSNSYLYLLKSIRPGFLPSVPNLYIPNNTLRLLTGSGMGLAMAAMLFPAFNQSIWADFDEKRSALPGWKAFGLLLAITLGLDLLVLTDSAIVLYPVAVISSLGVWLLLTMVYTIVWVMLMGQDNQFTRSRQLWLAVLAGFTIAVIQTAAIDALRFWFTGTWGAFPLTG